MNNNSSHQNGFPDPNQNSSIVNHEASIENLENSDHESRSDDSQSGIKLVAGLGSQFTIPPAVDPPTFQATQQLATSQICETMLEMGTEILRNAITENPMNYFRMLNAVSRLTNGGLRCERHLLDEGAIKAEHQAPAGKRNKYGITKEQMTQFRELLNEM